ncbi:MAG: hypothetical protein AB7F35_18585 [Acetobacteraceae bacterium]
MPVPAEDQNDRETIIARAQGMLRFATECAVHAQQTGTRDLWAVVSETVKAAQAELDSLESPLRAAVEKARTRANGEVTADDDDESPLVRVAIAKARAAGQSAASPAVSPLIAAAMKRAH